ncbi:hypothetical protein D3C77_486840 [compost metagenome]
MVFGLLVEPAFHHHIQAHHAQADQQPQYQPDGQPVDQAMAEHRRAHPAGAGRIGADVPDPGNQVVADLAAQHQPQVIGRHQRAHPQAIHHLGHP